MPTVEAGEEAVRVDCELKVIQKVQGHNMIEGDGDVRFPITKSMAKYQSA